MKIFPLVKKKIPVGHLFLLDEMSYDRLESSFLYSSELSSQSQMFKRNPLILPWDFSAKRQEGRGKEGNACTMLCGKLSTNHRLLSKQLQQSMVSLGKTFCFTRCRAWLHKGVSQFLFSMTVYKSARNSGVSSCFCWLIPLGDWVSPI